MFCSSSTVYPVEAIGISMQNLDIGKDRTSTGVQGFVSRLVS